MTHKVPPPILSRIFFPREASRAGRPNLAAPCAPPPRPLLPRRPAIAKGARGRDKKGPPADAGSRFEGREAAYAAPTAQATQKGAPPFHVLTEALRKPTMDT